MHLPQMRSTLAANGCLKRSLRLLACPVSLELPAVPRPQNRTGAMLLRSVRSNHRAARLHEEDIMNMRNPVSRRSEPRPPMRASGDPLMDLQRQMDRLFSGVMRQFDRPLSRFGLDRAVGWPNVELNERDRELVLTAELPGMNEQDIEVLNDNDSLVLRGERRDVHEDEARRYSECYYGRFERRIPIDAEVDWENVKAEFRDGLLQVTLPKTQRTQTAKRRIPISRGDEQPQSQSSANDTIAH
jgi:HSP20 family protein